MKNKAINKSAAKKLKEKSPLFGWTVTDRPLDIPGDNLSSAPSKGTSIKIFVQGVGVALTHTKSLRIKKLRETRETCGLELEQEEAEPTIGRTFRTKFEIPFELSENTGPVQSA